MTQYVKGKWGCRVRQEHSVNIELGQVQMEEIDNEGMTVISFICQNVYENPVNFCKNLIFQRIT